MNAAKLCASIAIFVATVSVTALSCGTHNSSPHSQISDRLDAGTPDVEYLDSAGDLFKNNCKPSQSSNYETPTRIDAWEVELAGILCKHPEVLAKCSSGWCEIPAGCFIAGSPATEWARGAYSEELRPFTLTHAFVMSQFETTRFQWSALGFVDPTNSRHNAQSPVVECTDSPDCPVATVGWYEALEYANALSRKEGYPTCYDLVNCKGAVGADMKCDTVTLTPNPTYGCLGYRLPTDAEWEYASRAGTRTSIYSGNLTPQGPVGGNCCFDEALDRIGYYCANSSKMTHRVGEKRPNAWGLFDVAGNVDEWQLEDSRTATKLGHRVDPNGEILPGDRGSALRGGSAWSWASATRSATSVFGFSWKAPTPTGAFGFRLVRTLPAKSP